MELDFMQLTDLFMTYNARPAMVMADDDGMHHDPDHHHHGHGHDHMIADRMYRGVAADQASITTGSTTTTTTIESTSYSYNSPPYNSNCSTSAPAQPIII